MVAVSNGGVLEQELARDRGFGIERCERRAVELSIAQRANGLGRFSRVLLEQCDRSGLVRRWILLVVAGVHDVDVLSDDPLDRIALGDRLCEADFDGIYR